MDFHIKYVCLLWLASLALTVCDPHNTNTNEIDDKLPEKPEPRQIGAVVPYAWIQPAPAVAAAPVSSSWVAPAWLTTSGQSLLSLLKPNVGGRRSSLSSRLRNLMNALFYRRETTTPYLTSGSSYSYAFRPPPFGFGTGFPTTGLASALANQNLLGSASSYRPIVLPNYAAPADAWSNYKQYGSGGNSYSGSNWNSGNSGSPQSSAIWQSGSQSGSGSQYSLSYPSYSSGSSNGYQASASNLYPNTSYQRSSVSTYSKPQTPQTSVSSSVSSVSSSSSSSGTGKSYSSK